MPVITQSEHSDDRFLNTGGRPFPLRERAFGPADMRSAWAKDQRQTSIS